MNAELPIVVDPTEVTVGWLNAVLAGAGCEAEATGFERSAVGTGQMAHNERYLLHYADAAAGPAAAQAGPAATQAGGTSSASQAEPGRARPASLVIKFPSPDETSRAAGAAGGYEREVRFYTELARTLAVSTPECLFGAVSDDSSVFTLVLEDLAPAEQGDQIAGASDSQIIAAAVNLAGLHGPRWDDESLADIAWLSSDSEQAVGYVEMVMPIFLERYDQRLSERARQVFSEFGARCGNWLAAQGDHATLVHGDYRLDNLMFAGAAGGRPVTAVDWQTLSLGSAGRDLAYLLGTCCEPAQRRRIEPAAHSAYREAMAAHGVELGPGRLAEICAMGSFQGPFIISLGSIMVGQTERGDDMFMAMAERSAALIADADALDLIA